MSNEHKHHRMHEVPEYVEYGQMSDTGSYCIPARRKDAGGLRLMQAGTGAALHECDLHHAPAAPMPAQQCLCVSDIAA